MGAHPWILGRCNGLARGIYNRLKTDAHYGLSAYWMIFGSSAADNFGWRYEDEELLFYQETSLSGQLVTQWKLRMLAQEAALREIANGKLRRILAFNNSFDCVDVRVGDQVRFHRAPSRKSSPRWRGPANVHPLDETRATLAFQGQTFEVARHCVRREVRASAVHEASSDDASDDLCRLTPPMDEVDSPPNPPLGSSDLNKRPDHPPAGPLSRDVAPPGKRTRYGMGTLPRDVAPSRRSMPPSVATGDQGPLDSFDKACTQTQGPPVLWADYAALSHRDLHELRKQRGYARKDSEAFPCAQLRKMDEADSARRLSAKRSRAQQNAADSR